MIASKPIYCPQLDGEAAALAGSVHTHGLNYDASNQELWCVGMTDVCASAATAYTSHVAVFPTPKFALLPAAGSGATGSVGADSNDTIMYGTIHAGTAPTAGDVLAVTFGTPRAKAPNAVSVGALNVQMGTLIVKNLTATGFTISTTGTPVAGNTYSLWAHVLG